MPVGADDPAHFMKAYHAIVEQLRADTRQPLASASSSAVNALGPLIANYVGAAMKHCDLLMSNIPGIDIPIWIGGAAVTALYGFGPIMATATNATLVSYNGTAHIGLNVDVSAVTDLDLLVKCVREVFDSFTAAEPPRRAPSKAAPARAPHARAVRAGDRRSSARSSKAPAAPSPGPRRAPPR
jgi:diacylglycerol O-acyltransferase